MDCLSETLLSSYLDREILRSERIRIEQHLSNCNHCLDLLLVAYEGRDRLYTCPMLLKNKTKQRLGLKQKRARSGLKWLFGALILFALSFVFGRFFLQLLVAAAVLGIKWAMEGEGAKQAIMIFKGIQKEEKKFERKPSPPVSDITGGDRYAEKQ